jgi:hypothetical protein
MAKSHILILLTVVAHWVVAIGHLFLAESVVPASNNRVGWLAIVLISSGHLAVFLAIWKLRERFAGLLSLIFFLAALSADVYEHFVHPAPNNIFMVASTDWTAWFIASVFALLALELLGCSLGILLATGRRGKRIELRSANCHALI